MWILIYFLSFIVSTAHSGSTSTNIFVVFNVTDKSWNFTESVYTSFTHTLCKENVSFYDMSTDQTGLIVDVHITLKYENSIYYNNSSSKYFDCNITNYQFYCVLNMTVVCTTKLTLRYPSTIQSCANTCLTLCFQRAVSVQYLSNNTASSVCDNSSIIQQPTTTTSTTSSTTSSTDSPTTSSFVFDSSSLAAVQDDESNLWTFYVTLSLLLAILGLNLFFSVFVVFKKIKLRIRRQSHYTTSALMSRAFEKDPTTLTKPSAPAASQELTKEKARSKASGQLSLESNPKKMASPVAHPIEHQESVYNNQPVRIHYSKGQPIKQTTPTTAEVYDDMEKSTPDNLYEQFQNP